MATSTRDGKNGTCKQKICDSNHYVEPRQDSGAACKQIKDEDYPSKCPQNKIKTGCKKQIWILWSIFDSR